MNSLAYRQRLKKDLWSKFRLWPKIKHQDMHNPESAPKFTADPRSTVFSKSANPLDLGQKSTIRALFKAKSVDPKTYSPPSYLFSYDFLRRRRTTWNGLMFLAATWSSLCFSCSMYSSIWFRHINEGHINEDIVPVDDNIPHCKLLVSIKVHNFKLERRSVRWKACSRAPLSPFSHHVIGKWKKVSDWRCLKGRI